MMTLGRAAKSESQARATMKKAIESGEALDRFRRLIEAQGGDPRVIDDPRRLPQAPHRAEIEAPRSGFLSSFQTREIGVAAMVLGAGRAVASDTIDPAVGLHVRARIGDRIAQGDPIFEVRYRDRARFARAKGILSESFRIDDAASRRPRLIRKSRAGA
jgi:thymidine phosphorylase